MNYWVICITEDNLQIALRDRVLGFRDSVNVNALKSFSPGDAVTFYVSRKSLNQSIAVQKFAGRAKIASGLYKSSENIWEGGFFPIRIDLDSVSSGSCDIKPLINKLSFIKNKKKWGATFMGGRLKIPKEDFELIQEEMLRTARNDPLS